MQEYAYVRVSTKDQNEDRQLLALEPFHLPPGNIFIDKQSGKDFNRPQYKRLLRKLEKGDILLVKSIDRLGRNYDEILEQWRLLTKERQIQIAVLDMPLLNTRNTRDLTGTLISDIVLQLLSYVAQTERENIRQRQAEGIAAAKQRGIRFGRPEKERPAAYAQTCAVWQAGKISAREGARRLGVAHSTFLKWVRTDSEILEKKR